MKLAGGNIIAQSLSHSTMYDDAENCHSGMGVPIGAAADLRQELIVRVLP